jgi:hypothetical protein
MSAVHSRAGIHNFRSTRCAMLIPAPATLIRSLTVLDRAAVHAHAQTKARMIFLTLWQFPGRIALVAVGFEKTPAPFHRRKECKSARRLHRSS